MVRNRLRSLFSPGTGLYITTKRKPFPLLAMETWSSSLQPITSLTKEFWFGAVYMCSGKVSCILTGHTLLLIVSYFIGFLDLKMMSLRNDENVQLPC